MDDILVTICKLFNKELLEIRKGLVKSGDGDMFKQEILKGCEIWDIRINTDGEIYVVFKNGDVLKGKFKEDIDDGR